jgi:hypothetical protein
MIASLTLSVRSEAGVRVTGTARGVRAARVDLHENVHARRDEAAHVRLEVGERRVRV